jgi:outer membrane protein
MHSTPHRIPAQRTSRLILWALASAAIAGPAGAQGVTELYEAAKAYDAAYQSALAQYRANQAKAEQAGAGLLPTAGLTAEAFVNQRESSNAALDDKYNNQTLKLAASQPLYRPANRIADDQARKSLTVSQAVLDSASQDLLVRLSQAYFDVLTAQDSQTFIQAQKAAVAQQLAAAQRNFEVGTATITDTREAQARYDLVLAQEIAAENDLRVRKLALDQLVGRSGTQPWHLAPGAVLPPVLPSDVQTWVQRAEAEHPAVRQATSGLEIAQLETRKAETGHRPTLDAVAQYQLARAPTSTPPAFPYVRNNTASLGVQFNLPLFAGFAVQNRIKETLALEDKARNDLEGARRGVTQATRTAFFGVQSGLGQVKALEAAEASSQSALDANQLGYQVGVRINIDVLNAQSQLYQTKASLAKARYDVLLGGLKLRQAAGVLQASDLEAVNRLLQAPTR